MDNQSPTLPPSATPAPAQTSVWAKASLILGILGITCTLPLVGSVLAIIFGVMALDRINKSNGIIKGRRQAITGIVLGGVGILMIPITIAGILVPPYLRAREHAHRAVCMSNEKQVGLAIAMYSDEHDGIIPKGFADLTPYSTNLAQLLICPSANNTNSPSYQILLGGSKWNSPETVDAIVLTEPLSNHRIGRYVLYGDGRAEWLSRTGSNN